MAALQLNLFPWHFVRQLERNEKMKVHSGRQKKSLLTQCPRKPHSVVKWCIWFHLHQSFIPIWCRICLHWWIFVVKILPSGDPWGLLSRWRSGCEGCPTLQNGRGHHVNPKGVLGKRSLTKYESWWCVLNPRIITNDNIHDLFGVPTASKLAFLACLRRQVHW